MSIALGVDVWVCKGRHGCIVVKRGMHILNQLKLNQKTLNLEGRSDACLSNSSQIIHWNTLISLFNSLVVVVVVVALYCH